MRSMKIQYTFLKKNSTWAYKFPVDLQYIITGYKYPVFVILLNVVEISAANIKSVVTGSTYNAQTLPARGTFRWTLHSVVARYTVYLLPHTGIWVGHVHSQTFMGNEHCGQNLFQMQIFNQNLVRRSNC